VTPVVRCGIDNEEALSRAVAGAKAGVVTNHTGLDASHRPVALALMRRYGVKVVRLFSPEHGLWGEAQDLDSVADTVEPVTGLPVTSLFGANLSPPDGSLRGIDTLVFDIQDIGSRYYTFMWTMVKCMEAAGRAGLKFVVLDRPDPVTGTRVEGNLSRREFSSFVGLYPCAARHGMTAGEMALYVNAEFALGACVEVVKMQGWRRDMWFDQTGLAFVPPSPNATGITMATLYPGTCLIEGTNMSEGRGTTQPFEVAGAPWLNPFEYAGALNSLSLPGIWFRPTYFVPVAFKHAGERCGGVQVHIADREAVSAFDIGIHMIHVAKTIFPEFQWRNDPNTYAIDLLAGTDELRTGIDDGAGPADLERLWAPGRARFEETRARYLLY
jgi:uncharacterized protein YbbC (DUF1343 family)